MHVTYLATRELGQVWLQLLTNHRVDGHQTEHAGLANATLCVIIALQTESILALTSSQTLKTDTHTPTPTIKSTGGKSTKKAC